MSTAEPPGLLNVSAQTLPDPSDPLGIDIAISAGGDLVVTGAGALAVSAGPENAIQALVLRLRSSPGDLTLHPDYGSQFNEHAVGQRDDPMLVLGLASAELDQLISTDRRFIGVGNVQVIPQPTARGLAYSVSCDLQLTTGVGIQVADLTDPRVSTVLDPTFTDVAPTAIDPLDYTTVSQQEYDTLSDIDEQQALINDLT
jgi:hypothetical protein